MRIGFIGAFLILAISGATAYSGKNEEISADSFVVESASWDDKARILSINATMAHEKGTLLTLEGLPASTMLDVFQISAEHSVDYYLPLTDNAAAPCAVLIKSAFAVATIAVMNAPAGCQELIQISGTVAVSPTLHMAGGWVTANVNGRVFTTIADQSGDYTLEVYSDSSDAAITITAQGIVDDRESVVHIYSGNIDGLLNADQLSASAWAAELFGRKHSRLMLAEVHNR